MLLKLLFKRAGNLKVRCAGFECVCLASGHGSMRFGTMQLHREVQHAPLRFSPLPSLLPLPPACCKHSATSFQEDDDTIAI